MAITKRMKRARTDVYKFLIVTYSNTYFIIQKI